MLDHHKHADELHTLAQALQLVASLHPRLRATAYANAAAQASLLATWHRRTRRATAAGHRHLAATAEDLARTCGFLADQVTSPDGSQLWSDASLALLGLADWHQERGLRHLPDAAFNAVS